MVKISRFCEMIASSKMIVDVILRISYACWHTWRVLRYTCSTSSAAESCRSVFSASAAAARLLSRWYRSATLLKTSSFLMPGFSARTIGAVI